MSDQTNQQSPEEPAIYDPEELLRESGILLDVQKTVLKARLRQIAIDQGFELLRIRQRLKLRPWRGRKGS
jgi:hypothetical protein